jgi:hypothetical protein
MGENQVPIQNGTVQSASAGGIINDPKILQGLTKAYNANCVRLQFIIGRYFLQKFLTGGDEYKTELLKIKNELENEADKKPQAKKAGEDIRSKEERESMFVEDQLAVFPIYQSIYKRQQEQKVAKEKKAAEKKG